MSEHIEQTFEEKLKNIVEIVDIAEALTSPLTNSIENLLRNSATLMNSEGASVLIRDGEEGDLRFLSAVGQVADQLTNLKVPAGKGIAGFVFSSGQPMTISDAEQEESFYAEVDKQTGFSTQTLLATPLQYEGEIIGVLEYVNRLGEPPYESFTPEEMDRAAVFAEAVSALVNAYERASVFKAFEKKVISEETKKDVREVREWLEELRENAKHKEMVDLAVLIREIASCGESERNLCREILEVFLRNSENDSVTDFTHL